MSKKIFSIVLCLLISAGVAFAQKVTLTGTVRDAGTQEPVAGAAVQLKGSATTYALTDDLGRYKLSVPSSGTLTVTCLGYLPTEVSFSRSQGGELELNIQLPVDQNTLEDAVIVGYGSAKKVGSLVGSISTVKADLVKNAPSSSALDQLQGQVAGLSVLSSSGVAGDNSVSITLHGIGSLSGGTAPLYIVDGIPSSSRAIMSMNPNDIQSISILKDASATSIYGSRAANGVVYVTTKSGSYDSKATITIRSQYGISTLADKTLYKNMMSGEELKDFWIRSGIHTVDYIKATYTDKGYDCNTKWYNYYQQFNNPQYQNDLTIEGGGKKVAYMVGASQFHQRGTSIGNFYDRYTVRSNVQAHPVNWLKVGANVALSLDSRQKNGSWGDSDNMSNSTRGGLSYLLNPLMPAVDPSTGEEYDTRFPDGRPNPHYYMSLHPDQYDRYGMLSNIYAEIEPFKNFKITSRAGIDGGIVLDNWTYYPSYYDSGNSGEKGKSTDFEYAATITNTAEYAFEINPDHKFTVLAGQEGIANYYDYYYADSKGQTDDRLMNLQNGKQSTYAMSESHTESKFLSFFGHADYTAFGKYIFDASVRNDACSRFGKNNRNAMFWAAGALWKIKKEDFLSDVSWIDDLNFKASYGTQGNAALGGDYRSLALIGTTTSYATGISKVVGQPSNNDLTWEKQGLLTLALTGRVFDFMDFDVEYYHRKTTSMLMDVPYPYTTGFSSLTSNVGGLLNRGVDVTLGFDLLKGADYNLRFNTTFNYNHQEITELFNGLNKWEIASTGITYAVGQPISFYYPIFAGIDPADGLPTWYLPGDDNTVTTKDASRTTKTFDEATLTQNTGKKRFAPVNGGFGLSGRWKGLSFIADFSYVLGKSLISNDGFFYGNPANFSTMNTSKAVSDFWTPENTDAAWPDWSKGVVMEFDTHLLENASFLRLKNFQLGYDIPMKIFGNQNVIHGIKVTFTGRNLLTFTKYDGIDPEVDSNLANGVVGNTKQFLGGIELTF